MNHESRPRDIRQTLQIALENLTFDAAALVVPDRRPTSPRVACMSLISRRMRFPSSGYLKSDPHFLMATFSPVVVERVRKPNPKRSKNKSPLPQCVLLDTHHHNIIAKAIAFHRHIGTNDNRINASWTNPPMINIESIASIFSLKF